MNELATTIINFDGEQPTVLGRDLHEALEVNTRYNDWFSRMCEYGFDEGKDFYSILSNRSDGMAGKPRTDHQLTIPMAKEICMLQRSEKGKEFRQYFIEVENQWNSPEATMARALKFANRKMEEIKAINLKLSDKIEQDKPKVLFADAVATANTSILVGDLAKLIRQNGIQCGQKRLFEWMRNNGYLIKSGNSKNLPTQKSMELGLFEVKERAFCDSNGTLRATMTTKVTGKGQQYFINRFLGERKEK